MALSTFLTTHTNYPIGKHPLVISLMKGAFQRRPARPRNTVSHLGHFRGSGLLETHQACEGFLPQNLSLKLVTLLALITGQRAQSLHFLDIRKRTVSPGLHRYRIGDLLQQSRPRYHQSELERIGYPDDENVCVLHCLKEYERRTRDFRGSETRVLLNYMNRTPPFRQLQCPAGSEPCSSGQGSCCGYQSCHTPERSSIHNTWHCWLVYILYLSQVL